MTEATIPDGAPTAIQVRQRIEQEKARAAREIAQRLAERYLAVCAESTDLSVSIWMSADLGLSPLASRYAAIIDVTQEVTRILAERNWVVTFRGPYAHLAPTEAPPDSPDAATNSAPAEQQTLFVIPNVLGRRLTSE